MFIQFRVPWVQVQKGESGEGLPAGKHPAMSWDVQVWNEQRISLITWVSFLKNKADFLSLNSIAILCHILLFRGLLLILLIKPLSKS
jgi:hypothetical protein